MLLVQQQLGQSDSMAARHLCKTAPNTPGHPPVQGRQLTDLLCFCLSHFCGDGDEDLPALLSAILQQQSGGWGLVSKQ